MEKLRRYCESVVSVSDLARRLGVAAPTVAEWCSGRRPVPIARCFAVERATGGEVTRRDLRPDDWQEIWPEHEEAERLRGMVSDLLQRLRRYEPDVGDPSDPAAIGCRAEDFTPARTATETVAGVAHE